jgi:hypothetical protein
VRTEEMPGPLRKVAFLYGPAVLAGDLGPAPRTGTSPYSPDQKANTLVEPVAVPILVRGDQSLESCLVRVPGSSIEFRTSGLSHPRNFTLRPFWEISFDRYNVYWDVMTEAQWSQRGVSEPGGW